MEILDDGSILIRASLDGPFEPVRKVKGIQTPLAVLQLEHGRPATVEHAAKQETIKRLIKEMQARDSSMTFVRAWTLLQQRRPDLFD